jgi:hypothetical protein
LLALAGRHDEADQHKAGQKRPFGAFKHISPPHKDCLANVLNAKTGCQAWRGCGNTSFNVATPLPQGSPARPPGKANAPVVLDWQSLMWERGACPYMRAG